MAPAEVTADIRAAIEVARHAPSLHNSQPWRWRQHGRQLILELDQNRVLTATDPDGHGAVLSCGTALELATLALSAQGRTTTVHRLSEKDPNVLAAIEVGPATAPDEEAAALVSVAALRTSDRRPLDGKAALGEFTEKIRSGLPAGAALQCIHDGEKLTSLALATEAAENRELHDAGYRAELATWVPDNDENTPSAASMDPLRRSTVPQRDFTPGRPSAADRWYNMPIAGELIDRPAFVVVLTEGDQRTDWLLAGEVSIRVMLTAQRHSLATCPLSQPVDRPSERARLGALLDSVLHPQLVIRVGEPLGAMPAPKPASRRQLSEIFTQD